MKTSIPLLALLLTGPALACAVVGPPGSRDLRLDAEEAIIVWDPATRTQHFIRRASFAGATGEFGFLVPTPTPPRLAEAAPGVFAALAAEIRPPTLVERHTRLVPFACCLAPFLLTAGSVDGLAPSDSQVEVLATARVAGYEAAVLRASDAGALDDWLAANGFVSGPGFADWLAPYVDRGWTITAFKYIPDRTGDVASAALRMSFETESPFFPYTEPADREAGGGRVLRIYFLGPEPVAATVGAGGAAWSAETGFADRPDDPAALLEGALPDGAAAPPWLTVFVDRSRVRAAGGDLCFVPSGRTEALRPEPIRHRTDVDVPIPIDGLALVAGGVVWYRRRRRRRTA